MPPVSPAGKVSRWQALSEQSGGKPQEHFRHHKQDENRSPYQRKAPSPSAGSGRSRGLVYHGKYIAFYGGTLSNFNIGNPFRGSNAMPYLLAELDKLNIAHPPTDSIAVNIMSHHNFICGEQFMMACKAFLFELPQLSLANTTASVDEFIDPPTHLRNRIYLSTDAYSSLITTEQSLQSSNFLRVLRSKSPMDIKSLGRQTPHFNDLIWTKASKAVVIGASLARANADPDLARIYKENWNTETNEPRHWFVEASPTDRVWGAGLGRENGRIADRKLWRGENRLGGAHDEACRLFCEKLRQKSVEQVD